MSWLSGARARVALLFGGRSAEARMSEELNFHIEMETERLVRDEHLPRDEARRRAHVSFGGVTQHNEELRAGRGLAWVQGLSLDAKLAARMLVKHPGLTLVAVIGMSVAVAIGAVSFSAIYTMIDGRVPVSEGDRIVGIRNIDTKTPNEGPLTHLHDLATWREGLTTVSELGAYRTVSRNLITLDGHSESARIAEMTASGFTIARVPPLMGRYFHAEDEHAGSPPVVVIGYDVWQSRFAGRPDIIGQVVQLGDVRHTVIGVMPKGFAFPVNNRVWTPLQLNPANYERGRAPGIDVFGRLAAGASIEDAQRQIASIGQRLATAEPRSHAHVVPRLIPYTRTFLDNGDTIWLYHLIQLLISMLLVVIGTNVAILVYARTASRMGEIAIRTALGASRGRVVGQLFAEALAMSLIAAAVGLIIAHFALQAIDSALASTIGEQIPYWLRFHITPGVVIYCVGLAVLAAVIVGVIPALKATGREVRANLQHLSAGGSGARLGKTWTFLVISQVTVSVAVLPVAIAGISAWRRQTNAQSQLASRQILTATLSYDQPEIPGRSNTTDDFASRYLNLRANLVERLRAEPGVTDVMIASNAPGDEESVRMVPERPNSSSTSNEEQGTVIAQTRVGLDYFSFLEIPTIAGRTIQPGDMSPTAHTAIVNRSFVKKVFDGGSPIGRRVRMVSSRTSGTGAPAPAWETIVGVVPDFPVDSSSSAPKIYRALLPTDTEPVMVAVRMKGGNAAGFSTRLREITIATNPLLRLESVKPLDKTLYDSTADTRVAILVVELVTLSTLLLSAAGIYALVAFTITRRRREIGIRSALGAGPHRVLVGVLSRVMTQVAIGILVGVSFAGVLDHLLEGGWTGRRGSLGLGMVAALMAAIGVIAALGPASRALQIQPTEALKAE